MFVYPRRLVQKQLDELADILGAKDLETVVGKLNRPGDRRMSNYWEVAILHAFSRHGRIEYERALESGKRPDLWFSYPGEETLGFVADIATVSDSKLDRDNRVVEFLEHLRREATKAGVSPGHIFFDIDDRLDGPLGNRTTTLLLPAIQIMPRFLKDLFRPFFRHITESNAERDELHVNESNIRFSIWVDKKRTSMAGRYAAYSATESLQRNPVWSALDDKRQVFGGLPSVIPRGIILCDGDCTLLHSNLKSPFGYHLEDVVRAFLTKRNKISFVVTIGVQMRPQVFGPYKPAIGAKLFVSQTFADKDKLHRLVNSAIASIPTPMRSATIAAQMCKEKEINGGYVGRKMSGTKVSVSSRAFLELLAGKISIDEFNHRNGWNKGQEGAFRQSPFERAFAEGRMMDLVCLDRAHEQDDDWITFDFGGTDPAYGPFRTRSND